jgi:hypothetical protein
METRLNVREPPEVYADRPLLSDLARRILKLRWMGITEDAEQMQSVMRRVKPGVVYFGEPNDTD